MMARFFAAYFITWVANVLGISVVIGCRFASAGMRLKDSEVSNVGAFCCYGEEGLEGMGPEKIARELV